MSFRAFYLALDILVIAFPFLLSFERRVSFHRKWLALVPGYALVCIPFIIWDVIATDRGHWSFNKDYTLGFKLFGLPMEELLFFFVVPYACAFTYEALSHYLKDWRVPFSRMAYLAVSAESLFFSIVFIEQEYTFIALLSLSIFLTIASIFGRRVLSSRVFWVYLLVIIVAFVCMNMILTSVPIVSYSPDAIWGGKGAWNGRFVTIPLEDFFYNITFVGGFLLVYLYGKRWFGWKEGAAG